MTPSSTLHVRPSVTGVNVEVKDGVNVYVAVDDNVLVNGDVKVDVDGLGGAGALM